MNKKPSILRRALSRIFGKKTTPAIEPPKPEERQKPKTHSSFEPLEGRIAPAVLINASTVQFQDTDGDVVTVKFSKDLFTEANVTLLNAQLDRVFFFDTGTARKDGTANTPQVLRLLDLTGVAANPLAQATSPANGISFSILSETGGGTGNGLVNVGAIKAGITALSGLTFGTVTVDGDLGQIDAGVATKPTAIATLTVGSLGVAGTALQGPSGSLESTIFGAIGKMTIKGDVLDATFNVQNGNVINGKTLRGHIGSLTIAGKISVSTGLLQAESGTITADGDIGSIKLGTVPGDGIYGGGGTGSGRITADGKIGNVTITGDIRGGNGQNSGQLTAIQGIGNITLGFNLFAGGGENSGRIATTNGSIGAIKLASIRGESNVNGGDSGKNSATISASTGIASLTLTGTDGIKGGVGEASGSVTVSAGSLGSLTMLQSGLVGGGGPRSGRVFVAEDIGPITTTVLTGGSGVESGVIRAGDDISVAKIGTIAGGPGNESGALRLGGDLPSLTIHNRITGAAGDNSGNVIVGGKAGTISVLDQNSTGNAILAGTGLAAGRIAIGANASKVSISGGLDGTTPSARDGAASITIAGNVSTLTLTGSLLGGVAEGTGGIAIGGKAGTILIRGSLTGGSGTFSGTLAIAASAASITIGNLTGTNVTGGNLTGGTGTSSGSIAIGTDFSLPGELTSLLIRGTITGGDGVNSATVFAGGILKTATIGTPTTTISDVIRGGTGAGSGSLYGAEGIGSVKINGNVAGGDGGASGTIRGNGTLSAIGITGSLTGGQGDQSGSIRALDLGNTTANLKKLTIASSITGAAGADSGQVFSDGSIGTLTAAQLTGASGTRSGAIIAGTGTAAFAEGHIKTGGIASIALTGGIQSGPGGESGAIIALGKITTIAANGALNGATVTAGSDLIALSAGSLDNARIRAHSAIGTIKIGGAVLNSQILAGYDRFGNALNGDASIGKITIGGNWTTSSIAAGVADLNGDGFGGTDDALIPGGDPTITARIASITITGTATGAPGTPTYGFIAQAIGAMKVNSTALALTTARDTIPLGGLNEITVREVA